MIDQAHAELKMAGHFSFLNNAIKVGFLVITSYYIWEAQKRYESNAAPKRLICRE
jgi:hypothetical protein